MARRVVHLVAMTVLEVFPVQVASTLVVFLAVSMDLREVPAWRRSTKNNSLSNPYRPTPITMNRLKKQFVYLAVNQYKNVIYFFLFIL